MNLLIPIIEQFRRSRIVAGNRGAIVQYNGGNRAEGSSRNRLDKIVRDAFYLKAPDNPLLLVSISFGKLFLTS
jgi:hypothetical protein